MTEARIAAGKSMEWVAEQLGCNKSSVSRWEQEVLVPSEVRIFKLAELLGSMAFVIGNPTHGKDKRPKARKKEASDDNGNSAV